MNRAWLFFVLTLILVIPLGLASAQQRDASATYEIPRRDLARGSRFLKSETRPSRPRIKAICFSERPTLFDVADDHPWNVAHRKLFGYGRHDRTYNNLLVGDKHTEAIGLLDRLIDAEDIARAQTSMERAVIQRQAWAMFDWLAARTKGSDVASRALRVRLARFMLLIALTEKEIAGLPNNYSSKAVNDTVQTELNPAYNLALPHDLFKKDGEWLQVAYNRGGRIGVAHDAAHGGRSEFILLLRFPAGRESAKEWISQFNEATTSFALREWKRRRNLPRNDPLKPSPELPKGTQAMLVQRMIVLSQSGIPTPTPVIESIEFNEFTTVLNKQIGQFSRWKNAAFIAEPELLLREEKAEGLRRVMDGESFFGEFFFAGGLRQCIQCHNGAEILSLSGGGFARHQDRPRNLSLDIIPNGSHGSTAAWKSRRYDYGLLKGILDNEIEEQTSRAQQ